MGHRSGVLFGKPDVGQTVSTSRADRVIGLAGDADSTFRGPLYGQTPLVSDYLKLFGNYRPVVRVYRCLKTHDESQNQVGNRPPRNGPYIDTTLGRLYKPGTTPQPSAYPQTLESANGPFSNTLWGLEDQTSVSRYNTGEQTLLPRGVGVQLLVTPQSAVGTTNPERYLRTGVIMFDPQGRLVLRDFSLDQADTLGQYIQLTANAQHVVSGIGLALYDTTLFKSNSTFSEADTVYQQTASKLATASNPALSDYQSAVLETGAANDATTTAASEEAWLDANATPLIINRYTGSMSDAQ